MPKKSKEKIHQCVFLEQEITVRCRKSLMVVFDNSENVDAGLIIVIGLNPSKADDFNSDRTVSVLKKYFQQKCRKLVIYNLFQNYSTNPSGIIEQTATDFTDRSIQKSLKEANEIVIAWGDETKYTEAKKTAIQQLIKHQSKLRMFQDPKTGRSPCHPRNGLSKLTYKKYSSDLTGVPHSSPKEQNE